MVRSGQVRDWLIGWLADRVNEPRGAVDPDRTFESYGLRSRDLVELSGDLGELLDRPLDPQVIYRHPTITLLAGHCAEPVGGAEAVAPEAAARDIGRSGEAIAVVGLGCRFPGGAHDPEAFRALLSSGRSGTRDVPAERWGDRTGGAPAGRPGDRGGYLDCDIAEFDADFFGISPREAAAMDPQQRLVLEVTQEALEHAGMATRALAGSRTGVFIGASTSDYGLLQMRDHATVDAWTATGSSLSVLANRVSHLFGLRGPSLVVDTACSSSLVAVHLAVQSLRRGESEVALAGGVNLIISPAIATGFDRAGVMARDGRCKTFDAAADGYGRGEGCGIVVLKRLSEAVRDNDRVLAVIRGSAVNSDGATNGLMAPNPAAQESVLRDAYAAAGIDPRSVDYVEAHGTGTLLGDPIEANALGAVLGEGRPASRPLLIGSVKSNLGHLEAAAGVAGLIKVVLALSNRRLPPSLHFHTPNPHIRFDDLRLRVVTAPTSWPRYRGSEPPVAGVSSFGFGGTNAHVVVEAAGERAVAANADADAGTLSAPGIFLIGGSGSERLAGTASALRRRLDAEDARASLTDIGYSLARRDRTARAAVLARTPGELREGLDILVRGGDGPSVVRAPDGGPLRGPVWVFSGHGSQWPGMGRRLLEEDRAFAEAVAYLDPLFLAEAGFSLRGLLESGEVPSSVDRIQPVLFGMQVALARTWEAMGLRPAAVIGHSMGEVAAAVVAGGLSCEDGLAVIARRSRLLLEVAGSGTMASLDLSEDEVLKLIAPVPGVEVAVRTSPHQTVIAGDERQVRALVEQVVDDGGRARLVAVDYASHSSHIDPILPRLDTVLADVHGTRPTVPFYGTVLADPREVPGFDAAYWAANLRRTVRFSAAVACAADDGFDCFVEVSPHPLLLPAISEILEDRTRRPVVLPTLLRDRDEAGTMRAQAATLLLGGRPAVPDRLFPGGRVIDLPTTAWRRSRHWLDMDRIRVEAGAAPETGTLLGERVDVPGVHGLKLWRARLRPGALPYPSRHSVGGVSLVPASVLVHTALRAAPHPDVSAIRLIHPVLPDRDQDVQVTVRDQVLEVHVRSAGQDGAWVASMTADVLQAAPSDAGDEAPRLPQPKDETALDPGTVRSALTSAGVESTAYPWQVTALSTGKAGLTAGVVFPDGDATLAGVLDAALNVAPLVAQDEGVRVPASIERVSANIERVSACSEAEPSFVLRVVPRQDQAEPGELVVDIEAEGPERRRVLSLTGVRYAPLRNDDADAAPDVPLVHTVGWRVLDGGSATRTTNAEVVLLGPSSELATRLVSRMREAGVSARHIVDVHDPALLDAPTGTFVLLPPARPDGGDVAKAMLDGCRRALRVINTLAGRHRSDGAALWLVTEGVREATDEDAPAAATLWGLAKVAAAEYPHLRCAVADLSPGSAADRAAWLARLLLDPPDEGLVVVGEQTLVPCVRPAEPGPDAGSAPLTCAPDAAYLITGGLGALGLRTARWLADRGARRLVLAGRTAPPPRRTWDEIDNERWREPVAALRRLERRGIAVRIAPVDVADPAAVARLLADLDREGHPPIRGVVHAAGVLADRMLADTGDEDLDAVLRAKAVGASVLHRAFPPGSLDFFVLFSSAGALAGVPGQGAYAAANAYLDALAHLRRNQGCTAASINWGAWEGLGFARHRAAGLVIDELRAAGLRPLRPEEAFAGWDRLHRAGAAQGIVVPVTGAAPSAEPPGLLGEIVALANAGKRQADGRAAGGPEWAGLKPAERRSRVEATVMAIVADVMGLRPDDVETRRPLAELGLDSIMGLMIRNRAERAFGLRVPATALWNHPTIDDLAAFLDARLAEADGAPAPASGPADPGPSREASPGPAARGWNDLLTRIESGDRR
ncbi:phthiocerol synthesis polyketide synthase type I PpsA [Actinomadura sp. NBRC 104412]|uniref:type I polyketide synthase n=1 Tax=Actinomadura sp. NBRC 104412 TaxID=3032203 RepID=UPI0024A43376|nr:type I polyketide synthase [Actinomadura sp. NBRC 104412]GLZ06502.1 phthiocerol synthesis polyketide synthase type I PpsA [Actinomadura sp. NBRC 104412]